jgi:(S)-3,5-dihydroxyphenylglycine transaminase
MIVSTFAGRAFEELAAEAEGPLWLQVYCLRDREAVRRLIGRAEDAGFEALVLTVDAPRLGPRLLDVRNGFRLPPDLRPVNLEGVGFDDPAGYARAEFDPEMDWSVVDWLRSVSTLPLLLKGIMTAADAERSVAAGVDGLVVSNHGGRQLDGVPAAVTVLPEVSAAVSGRVPVLMDSGIRRGRDVLAALALGADAVLLGRPVLHGLAVAADRGVAHVVELLLAEMTDAMSLAGVRAVSEIGRDLVRLEEDRPAAALHGTELRTADPAGADLHKVDLHSSVADPVMDTMNFLNEVTARYPNAVSFGPGRPYDGFLDTDRILGYITTYLDHLRDQGDSPERVREALFQYGPAAGRIRELIAASLKADENIDVPAESIVVTVGCQEAMFLALRVLIAGPDDVLLVSSPCYVGITGAAKLLDIPLTAVEERETGLSCADLEAAIQAERAIGRTPRAVYVVPDHSNPSGVTMPLTDRYDLLALADRYDLLILEDSPYRLVSPGGQIPTLKSLDRTRRVIHLGSYSKTVFPGARVGFAVADQVVRAADGTTALLADDLAKIKSMVTVNTSPLSQAAVAGALLSAGSSLTELNRETAAYYGDAMTHTLDGLSKAFPPGSGVRWNAPTGGFFLTLEVPFDADNAALARSAQEHGVIWTPMSYFYPQGGGARTIRLSTSYLTHAEIDEGISRLAAFIRSETHPSAPSLG